MSIQLLQYYSILSYLQLQITEFTGHRNTLKKTKGQVKFTVQVVGQEKSQKIKRKVSLVKLKFHVKSLVQSRSFLLRKI